MGFEEVDMVVEWSATVSIRVGKMIAGPNQTRPLEQPMLNLSRAPRDAQTAKANLEPLFYFLSPWTGLKLTECQGKERVSLARRPHLWCFGPIRTGNQQRCLPSIVLQHEKNRRKRGLGRAGMFVSDRM